MIYWLGGYMWLFVNRPFEVWPVLGVVQLERAYMLVMIVVWFATPTACRWMSGSNPAE